jgi:hypothetical protein
VLRTIPTSQSRDMGHPAGYFASLRSRKQNGKCEQQVLRFAKDDKVQWGGLGFWGAVGGAFGWL